MLADTDVRPQPATSVAPGWGLLAGVAAVAFVVGGLCLWRVAPSLGLLLAPGHARLTGWAVRCLAVAIIAGAQFLLVAIVMDVAWRRDRFSSALRRIAAAVATAAAISALALALASGAA
jgi:hypothetical protein